MREAKKDPRTKQEIIDGIKEREEKIAALEARLKAPAGKLGQRQGEHRFIHPA